MIEPNCDMPWEIYLDWLQDQGNEDLRYIDPNALISPSMFVLTSYNFGRYSYGEGYGFRRFMQGGFSGVDMAKFRRGDGRGDVDEGFRDQGSGSCEWHTDPDGEGQGAGSFWLENFKGCG